MARLVSPVARRGKLSRAVEQPERVVEELLCFFGEGG